LRQEDSHEDCTMGIRADADVALNASTGRETLTGRTGTAHRPSSSGSHALADAAIERVKTGMHVRGWTRQQAIAYELATHDTLCRARSD
jgi:hypothetical protein